MQREDVEREDWRKTHLYCQKQWDEERAVMLNKLAAERSRAERAEAERDAAFAAGQRDMQERAIQDVAEWGCLFLGSGENVTVDVIDDLRDLPIKPRP